MGHAQLLLRSPKTADLPTRIDVLFKNVGAIHLPTNLSSLSILEASGGEDLGSRVEFGAAVTPSRRVFLVRGSDFGGYVIAGAVASHEDSGEYHDPSFFRTKPS